MHAKHAVLHAGNAEVLNASVFQGRRLGPTEGSLGVEARQVRQQGVLFGALTREDGEVRVDCGGPSNTPFPLVSGKSGFGALI